MERLFYQDGHISIYNADCRNMSELKDESVQVVVTSPPYWGLRKYSGKQDLIWGGDPNCEHQWVIERTAKPSGSGGKPGHTNPYAYKLATKSTDNYSEYVDYSDRATYTNFCSLCGAWKGQLGLEPQPELYLDHLVEICREIRRVLRRDGVFFLNIGDTYSAQRWSGNEQGQPMNKYRDGHRDINPERITGLPPKNLYLIPFRLAIRLQEDGWYVRSVIIYSKTNPMPESCKDRPTTSHEYVLMLTKSARYYWDANAVREPHTESTLTKVEYGLKHRHPNDISIGIPPVDTDKMGDRFANPSGRNIRSVWTISTQPYPESHFATFPEKLVTICIKAGSSEYGCCSKCGAPWERVIAKEHIKTSWGVQRKEGIEHYPNEGCGKSIIETLGWQPTCDCKGATKISCLVLDPFGGSGTTAYVAKKLNRRCVLYELSEEYCELASKRNKQQRLVL